MSFPKGDRLIVAERCNNVNMTVGKTTNYMAVGKTTRRFP